ncbi:MAG: helix-turn-helix transcriptional regulator [Bacteroidales bacterium]|nr:helix-turn-helix transcriptional regulator [Bacteroidales bacterium]MBN2818370.1 helix-turn-helix transcriptional regulator [Bacteroidales bacterium]
MTLSILNGFLIFSIIQAFLFAGLFSSKKCRTSADMIMVSWLLLFSLHSFLILVNLNNEISLLFQRLPVNLTLLYGPVLLIYVNELRSKIIDRKRFILWHFAPFFIFSALTFLFFDNSSFHRILALSGAVSGLLYCIITLFVLKGHKKQIVDLFSNMKGISLNWIGKLVNGVVIIWIVVFVLVILKQLVQIEIPLNWFFVAIPLFISYIGYHGFKQQVVFQSVQNEGARNKQTEIEVENPLINQEQTRLDDSSYKKSSLKEKDMEQIFKSLENAMKSGKLFLQANLNLQELSENVKIPQHHITQTLNKYKKQNFYDYVNAYRVEAFINKLQKGDADNFSLLGIAYDCGFNSKSSFNRVFKNVTGKSPSEFRKNIDINN